MRRVLPFLVLLTAADPTACKEAASDTASADVSGDQVGPGPGDGIPVRGVYAIGICADADADGYVTFDLEPGTRFGMSAQLWVGEPGGSYCGDHSPLCGRPAEYEEMLTKWPAESIYSIETVRVQCQDGDSYVRLTYLIGQGAPGQYAG